MDDDYVEILSKPSVSFFLTVNKALDEAQRACSAPDHRNIQVRRNRRLELPNQMIVEDPSGGLADKCYYRKTTFSHDNAVDYYFFVMIILCKIKYR